MISHNSKQTIIYDRTVNYEESKKKSLNYKKSVKIKKSSLYTNSAKNENIFSHWNVILFLNRCTAPVTSRHLNRVIISSFKSHYLFASFTRSCSLSFSRVQMIKHPGWPPLEKTQFVNTPLKIGLSKKSPSAETWSETNLPLNKKVQWDNPIVHSVKR